MSKPPLKRTFVGKQAALFTSHWLKRASVGVGLAASISMLPGNALALALGKLNTMSHMGERLNVEIEIPEIAAGELQGLKASIAPPDMFQASGVEFNPGLLGADVSLQKRADGRYYLKVSTPNAINDPFVNLVVVVNWSSGRIVRDYSLLLDPPDASKMPATVVTAPTIATNAASNRAAAPPAPNSSVVPSSDSADSSTAQKKAPKPKLDANKERLTVSPGMTASEVALSIKPSAISLDQMLLALLKANPEAFVDGNVNRMKAGAVLNLPGNADVAQIAKTEARQVIAAQSQDFEQYKRKLAGLAPAGASNVAKLQANGQVESKVTEKKVASAAPDKLQLSSATKANSPKEAAIAKELQSKEDAARLATLSKNITDLKQLGNTVGTAASLGASAPASAAKAVSPELAVNAPSKVLASAAQAASQAGSAAVKSTPPSLVPPVTADEPSFLDEISDNPLFMPAGAGLIAILGGWAWYRQRQRKSQDRGESAFFESRLQSDSFFGVSGGQQIDTQEAPATSGSTGSSYTPSQLNAAADVDPIAEADVYLAYGRDMQAEEILKDAMVAQPGRLAIPLKLLEMYAKRADNKAFDKLAAKVKSLTNGTGPEWERVRELGKPLSAATVGSADLNTASGISTVDTSSQKNAIPTLNEPPISVVTSEGSKSVSYEMDLDFSTGVGTPPTIDKSGQIASPIASTMRSGVSTSAPSFSNGMPGVSATTSTAQKAAGSPDIIDFDLSALSLDLNSAVPAANPTPMASAPADPWATKLALAKEFQSIGDLDSARKMVNEVITGGGEAVKAEAKKVLAGLA